MPSRDKSRKQALRDYLAAHAPAAVTEAVWADALRALAPISESYLRELLRQTGLPFEQPYAGIRQKDFAELEASLLEMLQVYAAATAAGDRKKARYCRRQVISAKDHARFAAQNPDKRAVKEEMAQWMLVWLENPEVFPAWVEIRKRVSPPEQTS